MDLVLHKNLFYFFMFSNDQKIKFNQNTFIFTKFYNYWITDNQGRLKDEISSSLFSSNYEQDINNEKELEIFWKQQALGKYFFISNSKNIKKLNFRIAQVFKSFKTAYYRKKELDWSKYEKDTWFWYGRSVTRFNQERLFIEKIDYYFYVLEEERQTQTYVNDKFLSNEWEIWSKEDLILYRYKYNWKRTWIKEDDLDRE